ncbi:MAG TPA: CerR family C-terminal domain-containing protein [Candidatus Aquilonibacter sp.]|nr:CerR family C-terminal domain-containing protein [Candidatus Aquilonibacter sp.]
MKSLVETEVAGRDETRRQLLEAAGEVFAEIGFRNATIREICRRAGANIAAVNYHFGDKETLYLEVLRYAHGKALEKYPPLLGVSADAPPEKKLGAFVHSLLLRIFDKGPTAWHGKVMLREMIEPTEALDSLVEERFRPMSEQLRQIVAEILRLPAGDERVRLCAFSVVSQCVFYHHCGPVICRLLPKQQAPGIAGIGRLADHITCFSLAAMNSVSKR